MFFFFSSRRRHTRFDCDWSSDVCSSDLPYRHGSEPRMYRPDFIVLVDDGHGDQDLLHLVVEIKGYRREDRSEEHTSELQSQSNLVCRLLLEKKKKKKYITKTRISTSDYV